MKGKMNRIENKKFKEEEEFVRILKIFTNKYRLAIIKLLKRKGEKSVGQIADLLEVPFNTVSKNVLYLASNEILSRRHDTPFVMYKISNSISNPVKNIISSIL